MKFQSVKKDRIKNIAKYRAVVAALIIALVALAVATLFYRAEPATAATADTIAVHVYDPDEQYNKMSAWMWVDGYVGTPVIAPSGSSTLSKSYTGGVNTAQVFNFSVNAAQKAALAGGKKFKFIIVVAKDEVERPSTWDETWNAYNKLTGDIEINLASAFSQGNNADVYFICKFSSTYTNIQEAQATLDRVTGARITSIDGTGATVAFDTAYPMTGKTATLYKNGSAVGTAAATMVSGKKSSCTAKFTSVVENGFDYSAAYTLGISGINGTVSIPSASLLDTTAFIRKFETTAAQTTKYGASYSQASTTFKLWAPLASSVKLNLYNGGDRQLDPTPRSTVNMTKSADGIWSSTQQGDLNGTYYTYSITNNGQTVESIDPYAVACGVNGERGMVVDLSSTDPDGWQNDKHLYVTNANAADAPIVWEVSVKDFSSSPDSGMKYKGKYLAFTEQNTTVPGQTSLKTGINYLKDLGITYVHLNPVYDFATVDERDMSIADDTKDNFNWGYDPQNYNIPEGSYSTDPSRGDVRIKEFKQMVKALHDAGIGVIMDVVYNHTYSTNGQALHNSVPYYYHRTTDNWSYANGSGCGNETASERSMMRKYMVDSILYWATEYHIDGFRFDLMGIHDTTTLSKIRNRLDALDGGRGSKLLMYGEPWAADGSWNAPSFTARVGATSTSIAGTGEYTLNAGTKLVKNLFAGLNNDYPRDMSGLPARVAVFNDSGREGIRGNNDPGKGWCNGNITEQTVKQVQRMIEGGIGDSGVGMYTGNGARNVAYSCAHDNYTLWDQIRGVKHCEQPALFYSNADAEGVKRCKLAASACLMSTGISFILAGEEMGRTKYGNENSYNSPSKLNQIVWSRQSEFSSLYNHYKSLIALRRQYVNQLFSYSRSVNPDFCYGNFDGTDRSTGVIKFTRTKNGVTLTMTLDASTLTGSIRVGSSPAVTF